jgi:Transglycosylase-like domain
LRKLLASVLFVAALVPAVALASDAVNANTTGSALTASPVGLRAAQRHDQAQRKRIAAKRRHARERARRRAKQHVAVSPKLQAIAACESGGNPGAIGGGGAFRGKYQFDRGTWASVGGTGDPAAAPEAEQDKRAAILYARAGSSPWPVCGR